jgi:uncharacterized coiled-coil protein SlyX
MRRSFDALDRQRVWRGHVGTAEARITELQARLTYAEDKIRELRAHLDYAETRLGSTGGRSAPRRLVRALWRSVKRLFPHRVEIALYRAGRRILERMRR